MTIKCPNCQKRYMVAKPRSYKRGISFQEKEWICFNCPIWVWSESWFEEFPQFEHLIKRGGERIRIMKSSKFEYLKPQKQP